ncbi:hypothetical protein ID866_4421 [Astraeus odoratus]|nr:hypothetical protein ID866_4421 [Astraeus odoratus]
MASSIHLLVLIHGMWGNPGHLARMHEIIEEVKGGTKGTGPEATELAVLVAQTNRDEGTYDGIDWGGERVADEVMSEVTKYEKQGKRVTRFSVMGYSLGGLLARYLVGILHQNKFFDTVTPVNFNTIATPHVGIPRYPTALSIVSSFFGRNFLSRTGEQFFCVDRWSPKGRPLIEVLSDPDYIFYQALLLFPNIRIYANAINDRTVPYVTAAIEPTDPFSEYQRNGMKIEFYEEYEGVIKTYTSPDSLVLSDPPSPLLERLFHTLPPIPPVLRFSFPLNILVFPLLPVLIPAFFSLLLVRFSISSKKSKTRVQSLEGDSSARGRLVHIVARLEREIEAAALDVYDDPGRPSYPDPSLSGSETPQLVPESTVVPSRSRYFSPLRPLLSSTQLRCMENLNKTPQLKKTLVFFAGVANSHAMIVCRDLKIELHRKGEPVLRHWADHFEL